ncbi:hypothetical protein [Streptomyces microflavus]|uniref:hypothetical protein n=1 Tax=Streptomyces microflavus TaxID=1919 RepID=UPI0038639C0E
MGDTPADTPADVAAGVRVLGVATGRTTTAELDKAGATAFIAVLEDLPAPARPAPLMGVE